MKNLETKKSFSFFWKEEKGLKKDIERHRQTEKEIREKITELSTQTDAWSLHALKVYHTFLQQLLQSKAEVVNKLGRKK
jgi:hypothetical protein